MKLKWDETGEHFYETGIDHVVLYQDLSGEGKNTKYMNGVAWNGITAINENPSGAEPNAIYADNIKYLNLLSDEDFGVSIEAYTYPKEFSKFDGRGSGGIAGLEIHGQSRSPFGLSYRSRIGNDIEGDSYGYKLHFVYNCLAAPSERAYQTINDSPEAITFSWEITTTPIGGLESLHLKKPVAHLTINSTKLTEKQKELKVLETLEQILYEGDGTIYTSPSLPSIEDIISILNNGEQWDDIKYTLVYDVIDPFHGLITVPDPVTKTINEETEIDNWISNLAPSLRFQGWTTDKTIATMYCNGVAIPPTLPDVIYISENDADKIAEKMTEYSSIYTPDINARSNYTITLYAIWQTIYELTFVSPLNWDSGSLTPTLVAGAGDSFFKTTPPVIHSAYKNIRMNTYREVPFMISEIFDKSELSSSSLYNHTTEFNADDLAIPIKYRGNIISAPADSSHFGKWGSGDASMTYYMIPVTPGNAIYVKTSDYGPEANTKVRFSYLNDYTVYDTTTYNTNLPVCEGHKVRNLNRNTSANPVNNSYLVAPEDAQYFMITCTYYNPSGENIGWEEVLSDLIIFESIDDYSYAVGAFENKDPSDMRVLEDFLRNFCLYDVSVKKNAWNFGDYAMFVKDPETREPIGDPVYIFTRSAIKWDSYGTRGNAELDARWYNEEYDVYVRNPANYIPQNETVVESNNEIEEFNMPEEEPTESNNP